MQAAATAGEAELRLVDLPPALAESDPLALALLPSERRVHPAGHGLRARDRRRRRRPRTGQLEEKAAEAIIVLSGPARGRPDRPTTGGFAARVGRGSIRDAEARLCFSVRGKAPSNACGRRHARSPHNEPGHATRFHITPPLSSLLVHRRRDDANAWAGRPVARSARRPRHPDVSFVACCLLSCRFPRAERRRSSQPRPSSPSAPPIAPTTSSPPARSGSPRWSSTSFRFVSRRFRLARPRSRP